MKLSISYNVFDGEEWLESSINQVRGCADLITVICQQVSNFGDKCNDGLLPLLEDLADRGMIDALFEYQPDLNGRGDLNELSKRQFGLDVGRSNECTHHMSMDVDELYATAELEHVIKEVEENDYDACACQMLTYYKDSCYILDPPEEYYVPLLYKIIPDRNFTFGVPFPVVADPTRKMETNNFKAFDRKEIQMHHMSYVRKDIAKKLNNSSAKVNFAQFIPEFLEYFEGWKYGMKALMPGKPPAEYDTIKVKELFTCYP